MDDADARAILREHGVEGVPARGRLNPEWHQRAEELRAGGDSYADGTSPADFLAADEPPDEPPPAPVAERKPRRVKTSRPSLRDRLSGGPVKSGTKARKRHPRVPVTSLIERGWEALARLAVPVSPPIARCLDMQAPVAGLIMEDIVRDTAVDRVLQPIARAEEKAEKVIALVAPPMLVGALQASMGLPPEQAAMRQAIIVPMLRESLAIWVRIAGDKVEERLARQEEMAPVNRQVDELLAMILGPVPQQAPEDEDVARAQEMAGV